MSETALYMAAQVNVQTHQAFYLQKDVI